MKIVPEMQPLYCQQLIKDLNLGSGAVPKIVPNLLEKSNYVVHYRNLELYLILGIVTVNVFFMYPCGRMKTELFKNPYVTIWCPARYFKKADRPTIFVSVLPVFIFEPTVLS